jgi:hypothetical protein
MDRSLLVRSQKLGTVTMLVCLAVAGCGGGDDDPSSTPNGGGTSPASDICPALGRFSSTLQGTVDAVSSGGDVNAVQGSLAGLKDEYISVVDTLQGEDPAAATALTTDMQALQSAAGRLPPDASPQRVSSTLGPSVTAVETTVADTEQKHDCPTA